MNLQALRKHYDQLTPRERLAALLEARSRDDNQEEAALAQTAPKKTYEVTHHYFYQDAWQQMAAFHMVEMLNLGCVFYQGEGIIFLDADNPEEETRLEGIAEMLGELAGIIIMTDAAWQAFCKSERQDPEKVMLNIPGSGTYSPGAPVAILNHYDTLPRLLKTAHKINTDEPAPEAVAELAEAYKAALHRLAGDQIGGWG